MSVREFAVLEYVGPKTKDWEIVTQLPTGKAYRTVFDEKNSFQAEVPLELTFVDPFRKKEVVLIENYVVDLLGKYGPKAPVEANRVLKLVKRVKRDALEVDPLEKFEEEEPVKETKVSKKGKKDEVASE